MFLKGCLGLRGGFWVVGCGNFLGERLRGVRCWVLWFEGSGFRVMVEF